MIKYFIYSLISFLSFFVIAKLSHRLNLLDYPTKRKSHSKPIPFTGGLCLSLIYLFSIKIFELESNELNLILSFSFLMMLVGLIDDKYNLNVGGKLCLQIMPIAFLIFVGQLYLTSLGDYYLFKLELGNFAIPFTIGCVFLLINAANYLDGIDGVLSSTTLSSLFILFFLSYENAEIVLFLTCLILPLLIFIIFNFSNSVLPKVFLGDGGSLMIGFILSFLMIFIAKNTNTAPILVAWSVSLMVYEFLSVNLIRIMENRKIFLSGKDHLHYILLNITKSKILINFIFIFLNMTFFFIGYLSLIYIGATASLILFIIMFWLFFILRLKKINNKLCTKI